MRALAALVGVLLSQLSGSWNEPEVREAVDYYLISGATARQLRAAINRAGPVAASGKRADGSTLNKRGTVSCRGARFP
jgi:predicted secreted Zn-dependent protease